MTKLNEKIGYSCGAISLLCLGGVLWISVWFLLPQILFFFAQNIFLSFWGLTTFNDKYD